jgi:S1-C subfamily serine protease
VIAANRPPAPGGLRVDYRSVLMQRPPGPFSQQVPAEGVAIREVLSNSPADKARLQPDKVITHVNGQKVSTPKEYYAEMARHAGGKVELTVVDFGGKPERFTIEDKE